MIKWIFKKGRFSKNDYAISVKFTGFSKTGIWPTDDSDVDDFKWWLDNDDWFKMLVAPTHFVSKF